MKKYIYRIGIFIVIFILCLSFTACNLQGKSAYEIACENGFEGTELEWLESLNGKDGINGQDGQSGVDIYALFDAYLEVNPESTFAEFLNSFLIVDYYDTEYAAAKGIQSVVRIRSRFQTQSGGSRPTTSAYYAEGSGVIYRLNSGVVYIITNYHVVYDYDSITTNKIADEILIYSYGTETAINAEFIGGSITKDIAVIKASAVSLPSYMKTVTIADSNSITAGERAVVVGNPLADGVSVTSGVVSVDSEEIKMDALDSSDKVNMRVIRSDAAINSGNSGGGMFNSRGELLGIVNAKVVSSGVENIGFAIPVNVAAGIADCVIENNSKKCVMGITVTASSSIIVYNSAKSKIELKESVKIESVNSGALVEGVLQKGDILLSVSISGGEKFYLTRIFHLSDYLYKARPGNIIYLEIERGGADMTLQITAASESFNVV